MGLVEALGERVVPSLCRVTVHELARIIGVIPLLLQPHGEILIAEPLRYELRVTSYSQVVN